MYAESVINRRIEQSLNAGEVFYTIPVGDGRTVKRLFEPTYHSIAEVDASISALDALVDQDSGKLKRPLDEAEIAFITNERFLCRLNYNYYSTRYAWIQDEEDRRVRYSPRIPQQIIGHICAEHDEMGIAIALQVGKARQLGSSREYTLRFGHRTVFWSGINAVIASADEKKSAKLAAMMEYPIDNLPWWLPPTPTLRREGEYIVYGDQGSAISIESGNQFNGIARGTTPTACLLSELCDFLDPEELVDASLLRAMHDSPWMFLVLESTALGRGNWWHKKWLSSKEGWPRGRSRLRPVFLPWFTGTDIYPKPAWLKARWDAFLDYQPAQYVVDHARRARVFVRENDILRKYLGSDWQMSREQMFWYEVEYDEAKRMGHLNKFLSECCASDDEMFQSTNISVFNTEDIVWYRGETKRDPPLGVFGLTARNDIFPKRLQPAASEIDPDKEEIAITWPWGGSPIEFVLKPLKWNGYGADDEEGNGKIFIYEMPDGHSVYGEGVDTGDGVGKDRSVCQMIRKGDIFRRPSQIAEFASPYINSHDLWPIAAALAALYARPFGGRLQQPRVAVECRGNGDTVQHELMKRGYHNFHPWVRIDSRNIQPAKAHKIGVFTNNWFRKQVMDWLIVFLRDRKIDVRSPFLVKEMESLEADEFAQSLKAGYGEHDDRLMALGFIIVSLYQLEIMRGQGPEDQNPRDEEDPVFADPSQGLLAGRDAFLAKMQHRRAM